MDIVSFKPQDQEEAAALCRSIYKEANFHETPADSLDNLSQFFHLPDNGVLLLAKENNKIIGMGGCMKLTAVEGVLKRFYIANDYRGTGIAKHLLDNIILDAKSVLHVSRIVLDVGKNNKRAIRFYEKHGFKLYHPTPVAIWAESYESDTHDYYYLEI